MSMRARRNGRSRFPFRIPAPYRVRVRLFGDKYLSKAGFTRETWSLDTTLRVFSMAMVVFRLILNCDG